MTFRKSFKRLIEPLWQNKAVTGRWVIRNIIASIQTPLNAIFIGILWSLIEQWDRAWMIYYIRWYIGFLASIHIISDLIHNRWRAESYFNYMKYIHEKYMRQYAHIDSNYLDSVGTGKQISILYNGFDRWTNILVDGQNIIIGVIISLITWLYFTSKLWRLFTVCYVVVFFLISIIAVQFDKPSLQWRKKRKDIIDEYNRSLVKYIMSRNEVIQWNKTDEEVSSSAEHIAQAWYCTMKQAKPLSRMYNIPRFIINILRIVIYIVGAGLYFKQQISLGDLTSILGFMLLIDEVVKKYVQGYKDITKERYTIQKLRSLFDNAPQVLWIDTWKQLVFKSGEIICHNISYTYPWHTIVFDTFSLTISWKQKTALVWPSWGGKSTLVKLIAGYLHAQWWTIAIDGQFLPTEQTVADGTNIRLDSYYPHIGYLTQEPSVFDGTVRENLLYGMPSEESVGTDIIRPNERIDNIIRLSKCEFIYDFPHGLDTEIGEKWIRLSGWQRQRLAIAKIMLKNPDIILLDEPTSALDSYNEEQVTIALNNLFQWKTVIIIAHRLQTVKHADDIIYIADGKVIERWTHDELLKLKGEYYKMVELQSGF